MERLLSRNSERAFRSRAATPGGALLRSSRMFSLPKPLPDLLTLVGQLGERRSPTMTQPYPRHQSIASPLTSREKGDWGFKRPLPLRTTVPSSSPVLRIKHIDTSENVTDYAFANDHTQSLRKFQQLNIAMTLPSSADDVKSQFLEPKRDHSSVFEETSDVTHFPVLDNRAKSTNYLANNIDRHQQELLSKRWKYRSPYLPSLIYGTFLKYLKSKVRPRRAEFRNLLRHKKAEDDTAWQRNRAQAAGKRPPPRVSPQDISEEELTKYMCQLREDRASLYDIVARFLDLVPLDAPTFLQTFTNTPHNPYSLNGPPPSHPSAGISYLRTVSYLDNHPVYGPQKSREPVFVRLLHPRGFATPARVGVGGFVAYVPPGNNPLNRRNLKGGFPPPKGILDLDIETLGGAKAYVTAEMATVNPLGNVVLQLSPADAERVLVLREARGLATIYDDSEMYKPILYGLEPKSGTKPDTKPNSDDVTDDSNPQPEPDVVSSSEAYGLGPANPEDA